MYHFCYEDWEDSRFPGYKDFMNDLYKLSLAYFKKYDQEKMSEEELEKLKELFFYLEYYYASLLKLGMVNKDNFPNILEQLKKIHLIKIMDPILRKNFNGITHHEVIMMNPYPGCFKGLNQEESLQLATFHELGHIITSSNRKELDYLCEIIGKDVNATKEEQKDWKQGLDLLDEVAVQNAAEEVLFAHLRRKRPSYKTCKNEAIYPNGSFESNFAEYCEFQELADTFVSCLSYVGNQENDREKRLKELSKEAFSKSFSSLMYLELMNEDPKGHDLRRMLACMGKIKEAKYATFGVKNDTDTDTDASKYFHEFYELAKKYKKKENKQPKEKIQG